jgi:hypothetical protein
MANLPSTHLRKTTIQLFPGFLLTLGEKSWETLCQRCFRFDLRVSWGWGWGWMGPPLISILANARAGMGIRGQLLHMTQYLHVLRSIPQGIRTKSNPNLRRIVGFSLTFLPVLTFLPRYLPTKTPLYPVQPQIQVHTQIVYISPSLYPFTSRRTS